MIIAEIGMLFAVQRYDFFSIFYGALFNKFVEWCALKRANSKGEKYISPL